jgi:hypothetical protein
MTTAYAELARFDFGREQVVTASGSGANIGRVPAARPRPGAGIAIRRLNRTAWARARPTSPPPSSARVPRTPNTCRSRGVRIDPVRVGQGNEPSAPSTLPAARGPASRVTMVKAENDDRIPDPDHDQSQVGEAAAR